MSVLINQQDETINNIEVQAQRVEDDTRGGYVQLPHCPLAVSDYGGVIDSSRPRKRSSMLALRGANAGTASSSASLSLLSSPSSSVSRSAGKTDLSAFYYVCYDLLDFSAAGLVLPGHFCFLTKDDLTYASSRSFVLYPFNYIHFNSEVHLLYASTPSYALLFNSSVRAMNPLTTS